MVDNTVTKPLGLVLFVTAHMVFNVPSRAEVTGILGTNITLQFTFRPNVNLTKKSHFAVYIRQDETSRTKIDENNHGKGGHVFKVYPKNTSVFWHTTNLKLNDSGCYSASLFRESGPPEESNTVHLIVREENRSSTVPPMQSNIPTIEENGSSSDIVTVLVVSPLVLLAVLPFLIWCLVRTKDKQPPQQQSSDPTIQETAEASKNVPPHSLVYSVLDFPKRPSAVLEINPSETEYAAVSYLPETRQM